MTFVKVPHHFTIALNLKPMSPQYLSNRILFMSNISCVGDTCQRTALLSVPLHLKALCKKYFTDLNWVPMV